MNPLVLSALFFGFITGTLQQRDSTPTPQGQTDSARIERLIQDLGADAGARDRARRELRDIGKPAIPSLRKAAHDADAERALAARQLLLDLTGNANEKIEGSADVRVVYHDWIQGIDFERSENGHIKLRAPETEGDSGHRRFKTYEAGSLREFKERYPEIAKKYDVDKLSSPEALSREMQESWQKMKDRLGVEAPDDENSGNVETWIERQQNLMDEKASTWGEDPGSPARGQALGVLVAPVPPALRSQLDLPKDEGLLVHQVQKGSLAEKSGLQRYDVLCSLDGRPIKEVDAFRKDLEKALSGERFTLEILRAGKRSTIEVVPQQAR